MSVSMCSPATCPWKHWNCLEVWALVWAPMASRASRISASVRLGVDPPETRCSRKCETPAPMYRPSFRLPTPT